MGGAAKGLLVTPGGETILGRTLAIAREVSPRVVLVGRSDAYDVNVPRLGDTSPGSGPLGGLASLLAYADTVRAETGRAETGHADPGHVIALACDMPFVTLDLLARLSTRDSSAAALAPKRDGRWEPLFARFEVRRSLPVVRARLERRDLALQGLLTELEAEELPLLAAESRRLEDWDRPEDMA